MSEQPLQDQISKDGYDKIKQLFDDVAELKAREFGIYPNPSVRVNNSSTVNLVNGVATTIPFNRERWDTYNMHDIVVNNSRLIAPVFGTYTINANCVIQGNANGYRDLVILLNGITMIASTSYVGIATDHNCSLSTQYQMSAGDYVEFRVYQNSGVNLLVGSVGNFSPEFAMSLIR